ncbi:MAG: tetratricopeptide repeat protein [Chitinophagaceae bacterium]|nr:tetratricopeptide repeat protein [Chitinophagaceae bacterium]
MKKTAILLMYSILLMGGVYAQTIQEGLNHIYAQRTRSAIQVFDKILASNPAHAEAIYWKGQAVLEGDEIMSARIAEARKIYELGLQATNNAPLIRVGMGHVELLSGNADAARQHFETALTMTRTKKGDDPVIQTAIGRAIADAKGADYKYAVRLLEDAASKDPKNTETLLQLGNAYRKAGEGSGGGQAFQTYKKALEVNPSFAVASFRLAKLFESQKNWELVLQYLNEAVSRDPKFTAGYYELFYYYFYRTKFNEAETYLQKYIESKLPETDIADQFLYAQLCYAKKDYDCAIRKAEQVIAVQGKKTKPRVYRLLAYAYFDKGDYINAKKYSDEFFIHKNPDDYISGDHKLRADIISKTGGAPDEILVNYIQGAELDTVLADKIEFLKKGVAYFKERKMRDKEAELLEKIISLKPKPTLNDYFDLTTCYYFSQKYSDSRKNALLMKEKFPDQVYGYEWAFNVSRLVDTVKKDSIAVPDALSLYEFSSQDTSKFKKQYINSTSFLAIYYANDAKNRNKAIEFMKKWQSADVANYNNIQKNIDILMKAPAPRPAPPPKGQGRNQSSTGKPPSGSDTKSGTKPVAKSNR